MQTEQALSETSSTSLASGVSNTSDTQNTAVASEYQPKTLMGKIGQSAFAQKIALVTAAFIGGGALSGIPGCAPQNNGANIGFNGALQTGRMLEKEAKFSTIASDAKVGLDQMKPLLEGRNDLQNAITSSIGTIGEFIRHCEQAHQVSDVNLSSTQESLKVIDQALLKAQLDPSFSASTEKMSELRNLIAKAYDLTPQDFGTDLTSPGYGAMQKIQSEVHEWYNALERDCSILQKGVHAEAIAQLLFSLDGTEQLLKNLAAQSDISNWASNHESDQVLAKAQLEHSVAILTTCEQESAFAQIREELHSASQLIKDVLKIIAPVLRAEVTANDFATEPTVQKAVAKEALHLVEALRADLTKELTLSVGAQPIALQSPPTAGSANSFAHNNGQPTVEHHYHGGGGGFWYMPINTGSAYHGNYGYTPYQPYRYSGTERLHSSAEYQNFATSSHETHSTAAGKSGLTSHEHGPLGRSSSSLSSSSSHFSPSPSSHVNSSSGAKSSIGGFHSGASHTSGFGG